MNDNNETDGSETSYSDVLGLGSAASDEEIKSAYREQTKAYHPDSCDHPDATDLSADINQARDALLDGASRTGQTLNYVWDGGTPVHPTGDETDESPPGAGGGDDDDEGGPQQEDDDGEQTDDDDPWVTDDDGGVESPDPDPDPDAVDVGGDEPDESPASQRTLTRREIVAMAGLGGGGLLLANQLGWFGLGGEDSSGEGQPDGSEEFVTVGPEDSLQEAISTLAPGGTVELEQGTYFESITVDRSLTFDAPSGATLDGRETDDEPAIRIEAPEVTLRGIEILEYDGPGVWTPEFETEITLVDLELSNLGGLGIIAAGESVAVRSTTVRDCGNTGIQVVSTPEGTVDIEDVLVERSERDASFGNVDAEGRGITVVGGSDITVRDSEARDNGSNNIRIEAGDARGQSIELANTTALASANGSNVLIEGTGRGDDVLVEGLVSEDGDKRGISIGQSEEIESVTIQDTEASANGDTGVRVASTSEGTVEIQDVLSERSERDASFGNVDAEGRGITVVGGSDITVTDSEARDNGGTNIRIEAGDVRDQSVEIANSTASHAGNGSGVFTASTDGQGDTDIHDVEANANAEYGLDLGGDSLTITETTAEDNEEGAYNFRETDREHVTIQNSTDE